MGIHFWCHHCEHEMHVKDFQGGKRARCPKCQGKFRVPMSDAPRSLDIDETSERARNELDVSKANAVRQPAVHHLDATEREARPRLASTADQQDAAAILAESSGANWYVRPPSGGQFGPAESNVFENWLGENRVSADSLVWRDGWPEWLVATQAFPDYFRSDDVNSVVPNAEAMPQIDAEDPPIDRPVQNSPVDTPGESTTTQPSQGERNRTDRKQRRNRNHIIQLSILSVVAFALIAALIVVLVMQE